MSTYTDTALPVSSGLFMGIQAGDYYFTTDSQALNRSEPRPNGPPANSPWHSHGTAKIIEAFRAVAGKCE